MENTRERKPIKILHVLQNKDKRFVLLDNFVEGLAREDFRQTLCYLHGEGDGTSRLDQRFPILCLESKSSRSFNPAIVFRISKIIGDRDIDIVHCQRHKPTVYGTFGAWLAGTDAKVVATVHGRNRTRNFGRKLANFFVFKRVSKIVAVSDAVRKDILKTNPRLKPDKVATIYNGIDEDAFSVGNIDRENARKRIGIEEKEAVVFGTVGRLAPVKGQEFLLRAFSKVLDEIPGSWLVLAGSGPLENELKSRVENTPMESRVRFLGFRSDIPQVLAALDCFVLPSLSEGHPLSLLEAMACERPVIASAVGGIPEIFASQELGILVEPRSPAQLASAMVEIGKMTDEKRAAIGKSLRNIVLEKYTSRKMISNTAELYRSLLPTEQTIPKRGIDLETGRLTEKQHWEEVWDKAKLPSIVEPGDKHPINKEILKVLNRFLPEGRLTAMEIGGAPGQFLAYLSKYRGYEAYAMDYSDIGCRKTKENFDALGLPITIYNRDFFDDLSDLPRFDMVFSMGFVEHFQDLEDVVKRHVELLKKGGILVLGVPNFGGFNGKVLKRLAPKLLSMHNLEAMDATRWERFESGFGLERLFLDYIGGFEPKIFRRCENKTWKNQAIRLFFKTVRTMVTDPFSHLRNFNSPGWSAYLLGVYRSKF